MRIRSGKRTVAPLALLFLAMAFTAAVARADDYVYGLSPSAAAKAYFAAVPAGLPTAKISAANGSDRGNADAWCTEDGAISIPPGAMVEFSLSGHCMDPYLPAPASGEPMQFVDVGALVPPRLRAMYDNLLRRQAEGDPAVLANNPQHLVWAIRTAGTDDPIADNLSDEQLRVLDECAGRRGAFLKYHEKQKRRNAKKARREGGATGNGRVTVGDLSYDASELSGSNGARRVGTHITTLTEMGQTSTVHTSSDFRYGEIEDELYSDITGDGGLSFTARLLNASERRREFRPADFAVQVGNGNRSGGKRQRVTLETPREFTLVRGAAAENVEIERDFSETDIEGEGGPRLRGRAYRRRTERSGSGHEETRTTTHTGTRTVTESHTIVEEIPPVTPPTPVPPVAEEPDIRVAGFDYDETSRQGTLLVEIRSGSFRDVADSIREDFDDLVSAAAARFAPATAIPADSSFDIDTISIRDDDLCEVRFAVREEETPERAESLRQRGEIP